MQRQLLTGTLGQEGRGSAAVTVHGLHATEGDHELRHLVAVEAAGKGLLTALVHDGDDGAVRLDTQHGAGSGRLGVVDDVLILPVLDQKMKAGRDQLLLPARNGVVGLPHLGLGDVRRTGLSVLLVKIDHKAGIGAKKAVLAVSVVIAVHDQRTQGLADQLGMLLIVIDIIPVQSRIHGGDYVAVAVLLGILDLLGHDLGLIFPALEAFLHFICTGHDLGVGVIGIHLHHVTHLTVRAVLAAQNDFGLGNTWSQLPVSLRDQRQVMILIFRVRNGKRAYGSNAYEYEQAQKYRDDFMFHLCSPFSCLIFSAGV